MLIGNWESQLYKGMIDYWFKMKDFVETLEGSISTDVGEYVPVNRGRKVLFGVTVYTENMRDMLVIWGRHRGHQEQLENIDQQGNISVFTFSSCTKKDN